MQLLQNPQDALDHHPLLQRRRIPPVDIRSAADDHGGALLDRLQVEGTAILQRILRRLQGHVMVRFAAIHRIGHDPEAEGIELRQLAQKAAAFAVGPVVGFGILLIKQLGFPLGRGIRDGVHLVQDVFPIARYVRRAREHAGHPDDSDVVGFVVVHFTRFLLIVRDVVGRAQIARVRRAAGGMDRDVLPPA